MRAIRSHTAPGPTLHVTVACTALLLALAPAAHADGGVYPVYKLPVEECLNLAFWISLFLASAAVLVAFYHTRLSAVALLGSCAVAALTVIHCTVCLMHRDARPEALLFGGIAGSGLSYALGRAWWRSAKRKGARVGTTMLLLACAAALLAPVLIAARLLIDHWEYR